MDWLVLLVFLWSDGWGSHHYPIETRYDYSPEFNRTPFDCSEAIDSVLEQQNELFVQQYHEQPQWVFVGCIQKNHEDAILTYFEKKFENHGSTKR